MMRDLGGRVADPFQRAELSRLMAHLRHMEHLATQEKTLISRIVDKDDEAASRDDIKQVIGIVNEQRSHHEALSHSVRCVLETSPSVGQGSNSVTSRMIVALAASLLREALLLHDAPDARLLQFNEANKQALTQATTNVRSAVETLRQFAQEF